jgi:SET domain-containing protein
MFSIPKDYFEIQETKDKGRGVFALQTIKAGTLIGVYSGKLIAYEKVPEEDYPYLMYFNDRKGLVADKDKVGVHLLNHSCKPNCEMSPDNPLEFIATSDIKHGYELTISYMFPPQDECDNCTHQCFCGDNECLGTMHTPRKDYEKWKNLVQNK